MQKNGERRPGKSALTLNVFFGMATVSDSRFRMSPAAMNCGSRLSRLVVLSIENCDSESTHGARDLARNCCKRHGLAKLHIFAIAVGMGNPVGGTARNRHASVCTLYNTSFTIWSLYGKHFDTKDTMRVVVFSADL